MMIRTSLVILILASVFGSATRAEDKLNFEDHIKPIFRAKCLSCHNTNKKTADLDLSNYTAMMQGGGSGASIEPGSADDSYLFMVVNHDTEPYMPPNSDRIADEMVDTLRKWIDAGAPETSSSKVMLPKKPKVDLSIDVSAGARPEGDPPMPDVLSLEPVVHTPSTTAVSAIATSPWARLVAVAGQKQVVLYHSQTLQPLGVLPFPEGQAKVLKFSRNGSLLLAGGGHGAAKGMAVVWNIKTGQRIMEVGEELDEVLAADISADQTLVALGGPGKIVRVYNTATGDLAYEITKHTDWVTSLEFSPDSVLLVTGDRVGGLHVWEAFTGRQYLTLNGHKAAITDTSWRIDSNVLASSSEDITVKLWEMENGKSIKSWNAHGGGTTSMEFCRDGRIVTCGRDNQAKIWDQNGKQQRAFEKFGDLALSVSHCDETDRIIAGDWTGEVRVWNAKDGKRTGLLTTNPPTLASRISDAESRLQKQQQIFAKVKTDLDAAAQAKASHDAKLKAAQKAITDQTRLHASQQAELKTANTRLAELQKSFAASTKRLANLKKAVPGLKKAVQQASSASRMMAGDQALQDAVTQLQQQVTTTEQDITTEQEKLKTIKQAQQQTTESMAAIKPLIAKATKAIEAAKNQVASLQKATKPVNDKLAAVQKQADTGKAIIASTTAELARWKGYAQLKAALDQLAVRKSEHEKLLLSSLEAEAELKASQQQMAEQQKLLADHTAQRQNSQNTLQAATKAKAESEARQAKLSVDFSQYQKAVPALTAAVEQTKTALALLPDDQGMQTTVKALQSTLAAKTKSMNDLSAKLNNEKTTSATKAKEITTATSLIEKHVQQAKAVEASIAAMLKDMQPLKQKAQAEKARLEAFSPQLAAAEQQVEQHRQKLRPQVQLTSN